MRKEEDLSVVLLGSTCPSKLGREGRSCMYSQGVGGVGMVGPVG